MLVLHHRPAQTPGTLLDEVVEECVVVLARLGLVKVVGEEQKASPTTGQMKKKTKEASRTHDPPYTHKHTQGSSHVP